MPHWVLLSCAVRSSTQGVGHLVSGSNQQQAGNKPMDRRATASTHAMLSVTVCQQCWCTKVAAASPAIRHAVSQTTGLTVVLVCTEYLMLIGVLVLSTRKCTAPRVDSGLAFIHSSASIRDAKPNTCREHNTAYSTTQHKITISTPLSARHGQFAAATVTDSSQLIPARGQAAVMHSAQQKYPATYMSAAVPNKSTFY